MSTRSMSRHGWSWRRSLLVSAAVALGGLAVMPGGTWAHSRPRTRSHAPIAVTRDGAVQGFFADGVDKFLGIPYAAPPVGSLRWRPPQAPAPWHGVRGATTLPPACPQLANSNGPRSENEDCLYLSVYVPQGQRRAGDAGRHDGPDRGLPVLFWIHGGGLTTGTGNQHDGTLMATTNHIIVVSINYRLGVLGFLALPSLSAEASDHASGDYGLLDQEAALRWTRANIAAFGGDPRDVTIAGESAGAYSVCSLLTSPPARGLFARAVMESGSCTSTPLASGRADRHAVRRGVRLHRSGYRCHLHARKDRRRAARQPGLPGRAVADLGRDGAPERTQPRQWPPGGSPASHC